LFARATKIEVWKPTVVSGITHLMDFTWCKYGIKYAKYMVVVLSAVVLRYVDINISIHEPFVLIQFEPRY